MPALRKYIKARVTRHRHFDWTDVEEENQSLLSAFAARIARSLRYWSGSALAPRPPDPTDEDPMLHPANKCN